VLRISILLVDDDPNLLDIGKLYLQKSGDFEVHTALSAPEAIRLLSEHSFDVIVSDYQMPEMDGIAFLKQVRSTDKTIPFILFTGRGREEIAIEAFENGANSYIQKGGDIKAQFAELVHKIQAAIDHRQAEAQVVALNRLYAVLSATNKAIVRIQDKKELLNEICRIVIDIGGLSMVWAGLVNPKTHCIEPIAAYGHIDGFLDTIAISTLDTPRGRGPTGTAFREGKFNVCNDIAHDPKMAPWGDGAQARGYRSLAAFPFALDTKSAGVITFYASEPGFFTDPIIQLLDDQSSDLSFAFVTLEHEEQRRLAENDLKRSELRYRRLFESAQDAILILDGDSGEIIDANRFILDLLGCPLEYFIGRQVWELGFIKDKTIAQKAFTELKREGYIRYEGIPMETKDGRSIDVDFIGKVYLVEYKRIFQCNIRDISSRKLLEDAMRASELQYRGLFESTQDGILILDGETGQIVEVNAFLINLLGYSREQFLGKKIWEIGLFKNIVANKDNFKELQQQEYTRYEDLPLETADGRQIAVEFVSTVYMVNNKNVIRCTVRDITEYKRAEKALQESKRELADIISFLPDATLVIDKNGTVLAWNHEMEEMTGIPAEQMIGKGNYEYALPFYHERRPMTIDLVLHYDPAIAANYPVMKKEDNTLISETFIPHLNNGRGAYLWFMASSLYNEDGNITGAIESIRDITERKRAEEKTHTLQQFQQSIIDNAKVWISVLDPKGTILVWNTTAEEISGYPADEVIGKNTVWKQLYPDPVYRRQVLENILNIINKNTYLENFETRILTRAGDEKIIWWNTHPLRDAAGKPVQFIAIGHDNTERRQAEERIYALMQFEESVIKNANIWISVLDGKGIVSVWNRAAEEISGYKADEVIGKNTIWGRMYPDKEYQRMVTATIKEIIGASKYLKNFETRIRTKEGQERIIWWNTRVLQDVPGIDETFIVIGRDVTEQKTLQDAVQLANKKLNLLASITRHDILNQLMVLKGYLDLSHEVIDNPETLKEYIIKEETAARTIEEQIIFTRDYQELGAAAPSWQNVNANIQKAVAELPMRDVHVDLDRTDLEIFADPLFVKVFYNLIDNALRYGGDQMKTIRISSQESDQELVVVCEDDGVGISAEDKKRLFTRGFGKNTGLGLFLSREILTITGTTISENGTPGKGARFEIMVPKGAWRMKGASE
jgi:PAS domain S-box-containing protein